MVASPPLPPSPLQPLPLVLLLALRPWLLLPPHYHSRGAIPLLPAHPRPLLRSDPLVILLPPHPRLLIRSLPLVNLLPRLFIRALFQRPMRHLHH